MEKTEMPGMPGLLARIRAYEPPEELEAAEKGTQTAEAKAKAKAVPAVDAAGRRETAEKAMMLAFLLAHPDAAWRTNLVAHLTTSAWVVDRSRQKVLLAYHDLYDSWAWLGGHADGETDLLAVAMREAAEESGLPAGAIRPVNPAIFSLEVLPVEGHVKRGLWVPSHLHLNLTYVLEADDEAPLHHRAGENSAVGWFPLDEVLAVSKEPWMVTRVYQKLVDRTRRLAPGGGPVR